MDAAGLPDLVPTGITALVRPLAAVGTCEARITATIKNIGAANVPSYAIQFTVDGQASIVQVPNGTGVGRTTTKSFALPVAPGSHTVTVLVDPTNAVAESNEANNSRSGTVTCG